MQRRPREFAIRFCESITTGIYRLGDAFRGKSPEDVTNDAVRFFFLVHRMQARGSKIAFVKLNDRGEIIGIQPVGLEDMDEAVLLPDRDAVYGMTFPGSSDVLEPSGDC